MTQKVLILVDDEESFLSISSIILKNMDIDINIKCFTSTIDAENYVLKHSSNISAIISDYNIPFKNGLELLQEIRKNHINLPFIILTGMHNQVISSIVTHEYDNCYYFEKDVDLFLIFTNIYKIITRNGTKKNFL